MNEHIPGNVGVLDEVIRYALIVCVIIGAGFALRNFGPDWALFIIPFGGLIVGYLFLTSAAHIDFFYSLFGWDTRHRHR